MQALLRKAICRGKWILLYGSKVMAVSETRDEILRHFHDFSETLDPRQNLPGAICVQVGNESKFYRIEKNNTNSKNEEKEEGERFPRYVEKLLLL